MVRLGIICWGNVLSAYRAVIDKLRARGLAEALIACGRDAQRETACAEFGKELRFVTDEREVIGSREVDLVLILTSMPTHARLARAALEAGKHVLMEKPLATSLEDAAGLVKLAKQASGHLVCAPFTTLSPTFQVVSRRIHDGDIGQACSARARYGWSGPW